MRSSSGGHQPSSTSACSNHLLDHCSPDWGTHFRHAGLRRGELQMAESGISTMRMRSERGAGTAPSNCRLRQTARQGIPCAPPISYIRRKAASRDQETRQDLVGTHQARSNWTSTADGSRRRCRRPKARRCDSGPDDDDLTHHTKLRFRRAETSHSQPSNFFCRFDDALSPVPAIGSPWDAMRQPLPAHAPVLRTPL